MSKNGWGGLEVLKARAQFRKELESYVRLVLGYRRVTGGTGDPRRSASFGAGSGPNRVTIVWSLRNWLRDRGLGWLARLTEIRLVYGALKLILEVTLPLVSRAGYGEVIRIGVVVGGTLEPDGAQDVAARTAL
jgi:hypothetical protein